ncbi:MAG: response regulator [Nitrospira sp.]|nr:response regulator [Nitrospira sp.]MDH4303033.1 response regulator [Nitrospira sp.]MDH5192073.1 response regulator [Nitrospira sp.]
MNMALPPDQLLLIDPCQDTQSRITQYAHERGFSVRVVPDPEAALVRIEEDAPDIVITDLFLPDGAGVALVKELKARHEPCPVIAMGHDASERLIVDALRAGAIDYLHKPVAEDELASVLQHARDFLPCNPLDVTGARRFDYTLTIDSDPAYIPNVISWLLRMTASSLPPVQRLHIQGALQELLFNAVEHGNLEIQCQEKQEALANGCYDQLLAQRLAQACLRDRQVTIRVCHEQHDNHLEYRITDEGKGFPWRTLLTRSQEGYASEGASGRGIFLTKAFFPNLTYNDPGNEVTITVPLS